MSVFERAQSAFVVPQAAATAASAISDSFQKDRNLTAAVAGKYPFGMPPAVCVSVQCSQTTVSLAGNIKRLHQFSLY
jgi:hypothetical protein